MQETVVDAEVTYTIELGLSARGEVMDHED